jgi:hypothetical protein
MQTPNCFRTKRQLWGYSGLALRTYASGEYRFDKGQLKRPKKVLAIRGLNLNHNHDLKNIFKGAATRAATVGPFIDFYEACVARGMKPHLARLTLARKIAAITFSNGRVCHSHERLPVACLESNLALKVSLVPIQRCVATVRAANHLLTFYRSGASVA